MAVINILLSTYNGESYLCQQIDSILAQSVDYWNLIIRDDGSTDCTLNIIKRYANKYPHKIIHLLDNNKRLGSTLSFAALIEYSTANFIMLCDQDDFWFFDKVEKTYNCIMELEKLYPSKPLLVFTDLMETNSSLEVTSTSFIKSQKLFTNIVNDFHKLLALNVVTGCTVMFNKASKQHILPILSSYIIHDQWIAVNLAKYGYIYFLNEPTILYRQHSYNLVGSKNIGLKYFINKVLAPRKQFNIYYELIINLRFKVNIFYFLYYKIYFTLKRL